MRTDPTPAHDLALPEALRHVAAAAAAAADEGAALAAGLDPLVAALGGDAGAIVRDGVIVATTGWDGTPPDPEALAATVPIAGGHVVVVRDGSPLDAAGLARLAALAAALEAAAAGAGRVAAERSARVQAEARADDLARRQKLFEDLSAIQRSISHRAPLPQVLEAIVAAAEHLFG